MRRIVRYAALLALVVLCGVAADSSSQGPSEGDSQSILGEQPIDGRHPRPTITTEGLTPDELRSLLQPRRASGTSSTMWRSPSNGSGISASAPISGPQKFATVAPSSQEAIATRKQSIGSELAQSGMPHMEKPQFSPPGPKQPANQSAAKDRTSIAAASAPPGDDVPGAIQFSNLPYSASGSTIGFTDNYIEQCGPFFDVFGSGDVVYAYFPGYNQQIEVSLCGSSFDTKLYIYQDSVTPNAPYACNDDFCDLQSYIPCISITAGHAYYFVVDGFGGHEGDYTLSIYSCLPGERGDNAIFIGPLPTVANGDSRPFTDDIFDCSVGGTGAKDVFYAYQPLADENIRVNTCGSSFDTKLSVYRNIVIPGTAIFCNDDACAPTQSAIGCFPVYYGDIYYFVVDGYNVAEEGPFQLEVEPCCLLSCPEPSIEEGEVCDNDPLTDNFNGGCNSFPEKYSPIVAGISVCGGSSYNGTNRDTDWYRTSYPLIEGDTVTWCATANFDGELYIVDLSNGCGAYRYIGPVPIGVCDTACLGWRVDLTGPYAFVIVPNYSSDPLACALGPWQYNAVLYRDEACRWTGCIYGGIPEDEPCGAALNDGCYLGTPVYQSITSGDHYCGTLYADGVSGLYDSDWYSKRVQSGEAVTWSVRPEYPAQIAIFDITAGCFDIIELVYGSACEWTTVTYTSPTEKALVFFVAPLLYTDPCVSDSWEYDAFLDPGPSCAWTGCGGAVNLEQEPCIDDIDLINAGCGGNSPSFTNVGPGQEFCGISHAFPGYLDRDCYQIFLNAGDIVNVNWSANYGTQAAIIDLTAGCPGTQYQQVDVAPCVPGTFYFGAPTSGPYVFLIQPSALPGSPLLCEHGPWEYAAVIDVCACSCHGDPVCDGVTDILDVIRLVDVAFRDGAPISDTNPQCSHLTTDVNCDGDTNILDVVKMVDVAFRNLHPSVTFCHPCVP